MILLPQYKNKKIGVFGLGKTGESVLASLIASGALPFAWDDTASSRDAVARQGAGICIQPPAGWPWKELAALVLSPGVPLTHPVPHEAVALARRANCPITGDIELLREACADARYLGITGTNGKSTTTALLGHLLQSTGRRAEVGGNLGTPALTLVPLGQEGAYVLELSSYQLDLLRSARFHVAVLLNLTPDHLDRHGGMEGYFTAKMRVFQGQRKEDAAVIAVDDAFTRRAADALEGKCRVVRVSAQQRLERGVYVEDGVLHDMLEEKEAIVDLRGIATLTGRHNWQNAAAAYAAARIHGLNPAEIESGLRSFSGLPHRLELVAVIDGVRFINDSKATNAEAAACALEPYDAIYWIAGGRAKAGGIAGLERYFPKIAHAFLIGEAQEDFARTLEGKVPCTQAGTLANAVALAWRKARTERRRDAVLLLSPACASFDQWKSFEERGDAFRRMARELKGASALEGETRHAG